MMSQVHYLGHTVSAKGIQPTQDKVRAVKDAPAPTNLHQLKSFLGLINFYAKFLPNLSTVLAPLYVLLQKNRPWTWGPSQQRAFQQAKERLTNSSLLVHFSSTQPLLLAADASPYGLGGSIVSHDGRWIREADRLCLEIPDTDRTSLFATRQRGSRHYVRRQ